MNMNPDSEARRESARQADGKFGPQEHAEPAGGTEALDTQAPRTEPVAETRQIVLDALYAAGHPAEADVSHDMYDNTVIVIGSNRMVIGDEYTDGVRDGWSWSQYAAEPDAPKGWEAMSDGDGTTDEAEVRRAVASFVNGSLAEARGYRLAETAVGGPEKLTAAKDALWRTALRSSTTDQRKGMRLYEVVYGDGYQMNAYWANDEDHAVAQHREVNRDDPYALENVAAFEADMYSYDEPQEGFDTQGFTAADIDPESKAKVEADFEAWVSENEDAVKAFTETVSDPDGGDPVEFLAHNWWLTRNGHGTGFKDVLTDDADLNRVEALGSFVGRTVDTDDGPGRVVHTGEDGWHRVIMNGQSYDYPPGSVTPNDAPMSRPERSVRRAEALTALDKATPTREYQVYVEDGTVYIA